MARSRPRCSWAGPLLVGAGLLLGSGTAGAQCVSWSSAPWPAGADFTAAAAPRACVRIESSACVILDQGQADYFLDSLLVEGTLKF